MSDPIKSLEIGLQICYTVKREILILEHGNGPGYRELVPQYLEATSTQWQNRLRITIPGLYTSGRTSRLLIHELSPEYALKFTVPLVRHRLSINPITTLLIDSIV